MILPVRSISVFVKRKENLRQHSTQAGVATHQCKRGKRPVYLASSERSIPADEKVNSTRMVNRKIILARRMIFVVFSAQPVEHFGCIIDGSLVLSMELEPRRCILGTSKLEVWFSNPVSFRRHGSFVRILQQVANPLCRGCPAAVPHGIGGEENGTCRSRCCDRPPNTAVVRHGRNAVGDEEMGAR